MNLHDSKIPDDQDIESGHRYRITDTSLVPEFLPGDVVIVSPKWRPAKGDMVLVRLTGGGFQFRPHKSRGKKAPGKVIGVMIAHQRKMRIDGKPRCMWSPSRASTPPPHSRRASPASAEPPSRMCRQYARKE